MPKFSDQLLIAEFRHRHFETSTDSQEADFVRAPEDFVPHDFVPHVSHEVSQLSFSQLSVSQLCWRAAARVESSSCDLTKRENRNMFRMLSMELYPRSCDSQACIYASFEQAFRMSILCPHLVREIVRGHAYGLCLPGI